MLDVYDNVELELCSLEYMADEELGDVTTTCLHDDVTLDVYELMEY